MADHEDIPKASRKGRRATRLKSLTINRSGDQRIQLEFDNDCMPIGPMEKKFCSYVALLARSKASIICEDWDHVPAGVKDHIWDSITLTFDVPNTERMRRKWIKYAGERWRAFKTNLSRNYIYGQTDESPLDMYPFLDQETWDTFVRSRLDPAFQDKRKKAQQIQSQNVHPHILSRGGYKMLREKMIEEKKKSIEEEASHSGQPPEVFDPTPPPRHHTWKRARQRASGQYTSDEARLVAERIDSLDEQSSQGTFVPKGRQDILATAIGKPDHPGRVIGVGWGIGIRQYHGPASHYQRNEDVEFREQIKREIREELREEFAQQLESLGISRQNTNAQSSVHVSTKGSSHHPQEEEGGNRCELYVDDNHDCRLVALGRVNNLGTTVHHQPLDDDHVSVVVEDIRDADALVPVPTDEVQTVGQAPGTFIVWPRRLVRLSVSDKDVEKDVRHSRSDPRRRVKSTSDKGIDKRDECDALARLAIAAVRMGKDPIVMELEHDGRPDGPFMLPQRDIMEIALDGEMVCFTCVSLWCTYIHRLCIERNNQHIYGFMDPGLIQGEWLEVEEISTNMRRILTQSNKQCYLAPYLKDKHWQLLIICPRMNVVAFFCSLGRKPTKDFRGIVETSMNACRMLEGVRPTRPIRWFLPNCQKQRSGWECGYYVMKWMLDIVSAGILEGWKEIFDSPDALSEDEIMDIKKRWANFFLQCTNL